MARKKVRWPEPAYSLGDPDVLHAAGAVAVTFNVLEVQIKSLFSIYTNIPDLAGAFLFGRISTELLIDTIQRCVHDSEHTEPIKSTVRHFLRAYSIAFQNRNILMHSRIVMRGYPAAYRITAFAKTPKDDPLNTHIYEPTLQELRDIADKNHELSEFAGNLIGHILRRYLPHLVHEKFVDEAIPLPSKPDLPVPLSQPTPVFPGKLIPPPRSSRT